MKCKLCGFEFDDNNIEESIETHLLEKHYLGYQEYYEVTTLSTPNMSCWKCGSSRYLLSPYMSGVYLPCSCCMKTGNKQYIQEMKSDFFSKIKDYQSKILKSRYYQYILSLDSTNRKRLLPKDIEVQSENIRDLKRKVGDKIDKFSIFEITNLLGKSSEISSRNLDALTMEISELKITEESPGIWKMDDFGFYLKLPEIVPFDPKHHSRGSILNKSAKRTTRRLKISETGECIKFWNVPNLAVRTILSLTDKDDNAVSFQDLSDEIKWKIRFGILKTKPILNRIFDIYNEIIKFSYYLEDSVFLLNSFKVPANQENFKFELTWSWEEYSWDPKDEDCIKLSIL